MAVVAGRLVARLPGSPAWPAAVQSLLVTASPCQSYRNEIGGGGGASSATGGCTISHVTLKDMAALPDGVPPARGTVLRLPLALPCNLWLVVACSRSREEARCDTLG